MCYFFSDYIERFEILFRQGNYQKLLDECSALLKRDPNNSQLLQYKLRALQNLGQSLDDLGFLRKYCWYFSLDPQGFECLARGYWQEGDWRNAVIALLFLLSVDKGNKVANKMLSSILREHGFIDAKLSVLRIERMGHMVLEADLWLRRLALSGKLSKTLTLFLCDSEDKVSNKFAFDLLSREIDIVQNPFWLKIFHSRPELLNPGFYQQLPYDSSGWSKGFGASNLSVLERHRESQELYGLCPSVVSLSESELRIGWNLLAKKGLSPKSKVVCLHVRDKAFIDQLSGDSNSQRLSYHDYRDADIRTYESAVKYLLKNEYIVFRMGSVSNQKLSITHQNYFDLDEHFSKQDARFLDVFLAAICTFYIGTTSGPFALAALFDTPFLVTNAVPLVPYTLRYSMCLPKVYLADDKGALNFVEVINGEHQELESGDSLLNCLNGNELEKSGYSVRNNTEREILEGVVEFEQWVTKKKLSKIMLPLQKKFKNQLKEGHPLKESSSLVMESFMRQNPGLF